VVEIQDLEHLESLLDKAGSSLVVVAFYTRSCGVCKELLKEFQSMCDEAKAAQVRVGFARGANGSSVFALGVMKAHVRCKSFKQSY
jgi:Zn-dependent alcohol dehydrogenase